MDFVVHVDLEHRGSRRNVRNARFQSKLVRARRLRLQKLELVGERGGRLVDFIDVGEPVAFRGFRNDRGGRCDVR